MMLLPPSPPIGGYEPTHLVKATGAIEIRPKDGGDLSLAARRLFSHLLAHAYPRLRDAWPKAREAADQARQQAREASNSSERQEQAARRAMLRVLADVAEHQVSAVQIRRFAAEARQGIEDVNNTRLRDALQRLQTLLVEFNYLQSDGTVWESMTLLGPSRIARDGTLTYSFHPALLEKLIEPALYSYLSLRVIYQFESKYGLALYEILKRYSDRSAAAPYWQVQTEVLRELLGCSGRLKDWKDFRRYALDPAMTEIGEIAEFRVELDEVRQGGGRGGGKVVGCVFRVIRKNREDAEMAVRQIDKPRVQRRGERLSRKVPIKSKVVEELAIRFLDGADVATRRQWVERARELGVRLPPAAGSRETLSAWVPAVAKLVCQENGLT